jgi:hypothetical protein
VQQTPISINDHRSHDFFIMAGGGQEAAVGSPAPKQKGKATIDTLK